MSGVSRTPKDHAANVVYRRLRDRGLIGAEDMTHQDPMWALILNFVVWLLIFELIAVWAVRRGRRRQ